MNDNFVGMQLSELPTPALLVDADQLSANLQRMQRLVTDSGQALRPHIKTHKCSSLAKMQIEIGAVGVTCATLGEAEAMSAAGIQDILIANQLVTFDKLQRVAQIQSRSDVKFVVDSLEGIRIAEEAARSFHCIFEVLVEVDVGGGRCGARSPMEALSLAQAVLGSSALRFGGVQAYYGGLSYIPDLQKRAEACLRSDQALKAYLEPIQGLCTVPRVSGAGTGHTANLLQFATLTEFQSGSYVYSDTTYSKLSPEYPSALFVLSTVLSRPTAGMIVMDAGLKALGTEFSTPLLADYPNLVMDHYSEEHVQWFINSESAPKVGEKARIIPAHCCTTVNHYRRCFLIRDERVAEVWNIDAY